MVLENMLRNIREYWNNFELELVRYQTKCKLIKGFDDLFQKLDEDISNLQSTKMSPYFKVNKIIKKDIVKKIRKKRINKN
jgi:dynein heavy chain 1, cytosolic